MWIHKCTNLCVSKGACALGVWDIWSIVIKCFVIVHSVLRAWQQVRLIPCESWTPPALPLYHWFWQFLCAAKRWRQSNSVDSGSHLCFLLMWFWWLNRAMTSSLQWSSLQQSVRWLRNGVSTTTHELLPPSGGVQSNSGSWEGKGK